MSKPLLCRLNLRHHWHAESTDDGRRFRRCTRCGKVYDHDMGHWAGGMTPGG